MEIDDFSSGIRHWGYYSFYLAMGKVLAILKGGLATIKLMNTIVSIFLLGLFFSYFLLLSPNFIISIFIVTSAIFLGYKIGENASQKNSLK